MKILILVSTLNDGIYNVDFNHDFDYFISHQVDNGKGDEYDCFIRDKINSSKINVSYIPLNGRGLSRSRNNCLLNSEKNYDFFWIMDDDVVVHSDAYKRICKYLTDCKDKVRVMYLLRHSSDLETKTLGREFKHNIFTVASASSIDMLISRDILVDKRVYFDESFGLGTSYTSGEEYIFSTDLLKNGYAIFQTNIVVSYHPPIASGLDFYSSRQKLITKLKMFQRVFGSGFGFVMYLIFLTKKSPLLAKEKALKRALSTLFY